jgi:hypothetical protein
MSKCKARDPKESWFLWIAENSIPLQQVTPGYKGRYGQEHGYRFQKQALLWSQSRLRTPEQFERWTQVVPAMSVPSSALPCAVGGSTAPSLDARADLLVVGRAGTRGAGAHQNASG